MKPIVVEELKAAIRRAGVRIEKKRKNSLLNNLLFFLSQKNVKEAHKIALPSARETHFVKPADIIYCEASNNYTIFHLVSKEKLVISKPLFEYEELLEDYRFIRCHNSYLVNQLYIKSLLKENGTAYF